MFCVLAKEIEKECDQGEYIAHSPKRFYENMN